MHREITHAISRIRDPTVDIARQIESLDEVGSIPAFRVNRGAIASVRTAEVLDPAEVQHAATDREVRS